MSSKKQSARSKDTSPTRGQGEPPLDRLTKVPRVAPVYLRPLLIEAARTGVDPAPWFRGLAFSPDDLDEPGFMVSHHEAVTVVRRALALLNNPRLGLELGMRSRITHRGALALGILASPTLQASIDLSLRFPESAGFLLRVRAVHPRGRHTLIAEPVFDSHDLSAFLVDKLFVGMVQQMRQIGDAGCSPVLVELVRPPPADAMSHEQHYRAPVRFNSKSNRLTFDDRWMSTPLATCDLMSHRLALALLQREATRLGHAPAFRLAVERAIRSMHPQVPTLGQVAALFHLSERSIRRKLAEEDVSFRGLLDNSRRERALDLILNGRRSLSDATEETGFSDARSFRRAFRRWTGSTPSSVRDLHEPDSPYIDPSG
jgi:AraC-like DNA-binding protein